MLLRALFIFSLFLLPLKNFAESAKNKVLSKAEQADSSCFLEYSHGAADCNDSAGDAQ